MSRGNIAVGVASGVLLVASVGGLVAVRAAQAPARFSSGGVFAGPDVTRPEEAARSATTDPSATSTSTGTDPTAPATSEQSSSSSSSTGPTTTVFRGGYVAPTTVTATTAGTAAPANGAVRAVPARGLWTWAVDGNEAVTGYGSRRLPDRMQMQVHGDPGIPADASVLDLTYSQDHQEREIVRYTDKGLVMTFEGGKVRFGGASQTNSSTYLPPMVNVPAPLIIGQRATGTTEVRADDGSVDRVEDWVATVVGQEQVTVGTTPVATWKVTLTRRSRPGGSQDVVRDRTYWFAPSLGLPVKYTEHFKGTQKVIGVDFSFSSDLVATLLTHP